jgi:hypothetical protein
LCLWKKRRREGGDGGRRRRVGNHYQGEGRVIEIELHLLLL